MNKNMTIYILKNPMLSCRLLFSGGAHRCRGVNVRRRGSGLGAKARWTVDCVGVGTIVKQEPTHLPQSSALEQHTAPEY